MICENCKNEKSVIHTQQIVNHQILDNFIGENCLNIEELNYGGLHDLYVTSKKELKENEELGKRVGITSSDFKAEWLRLHLLVKKLRKEVMRRDLLKIKSGNYQIVDRFGVEI